MTIKSAAQGFLRILWQILAAMNLIMLVFDFAITPIYWRGVVFSTLMIGYCLFFLWRHAKRVAEEEAEPKYRMFVTTTPDCNENGTCCGATTTVKITSDPNALTSTTNNTSSYTFEKNPAEWEEGSDNPPTPPPDESPPPEMPTK